MPPPDPAGARDDPAPDDAPEAEPDFDQDGGDDEPDRDDAPAGWARLRWVPALGCGLVGGNVAIIGLMMAIRLTVRVRDEGWRPFASSPAGPALALAYTAGGVLSFLLGGIAGLLSASAWMAGRWSRAWLMALASIVWIVAGAFLLGLSLVRL